MLTFEKFAGINNQQPAARLAENELSAATNVDIDATGQVRRRDGYERTSTDAHSNLFAAHGMQLATVGLNGDLKNLKTGVVLYPSLGHSRAWYCALSDRRVVFSNGLICGVTDGATTTTAWGVSAPPSIGAATDVAGALFPGEYRYAITYVRNADGLESAPLMSEPFQVQEGGVFLSGLPVRAGHTINAYLTSHNDGEFYLAGNTATGLFSFAGENDALVVPCRTAFTSAPHAGRCLVAWRGRVLYAVGNVLYATEAASSERVNLRRDFKQFADPITAVVPVDDGVYVGTEGELAFLSGDRFDALTYGRVADGRVVLGSGVAVRGELVKQGDGTGTGKAMICIADQTLIAGFNGGLVIRMTEGRYKVEVDEVFATFRSHRGMHQYIAIPR